jgi:hypothetical protein
MPERCSRAQQARRRHREKGRPEMPCIDIAPQQLAQKPASAVSDLDRRRTLRSSRMELPLRCVSSGYLSDGCSCPRTIPADVVIAAWARELERAGGERFFHFAWRDGMWLAYGLDNGLVRGVYCPDHSAERDERSYSYGSRQNPSARQIVVSA